MTIATKMRKFYGKKDVTVTGKVLLTPVALIVYITQAIINSLKEFYYASFAKKVGMLWVAMCFVILCYFAWSFLDCLIAMGEAGPFEGFGKYTSVYNFFNIFK